MLWGIYLPQTAGYERINNAQSLRPLLAFQGSWLGLIWGLIWGLKWEKSKSLALSACPRSFAFQGRHRLLPTALSLSAPPQRSLSAAMEGAGAAAIVPDAAALNMMAAAAEHQVDAVQPDEVPAVPTAVGGAPDDGAEGGQVFPNDPKYLSAASIQPGCAKYILAGWQPSSEKPAKKHLTLAMGTRQLLPHERQPKPENWAVQKIAD